MTVAMILAGDVGKRMGEPLPKQFIEINGKPVIAYTLEVYQKREDFDIQVIRVEGYENLVWEIARKYNITKLKWVVRGGDSGLAYLHWKGSLMKRISSLKQFQLVLLSMML